MRRALLQSLQCPACAGDRSLRLARGAEEAPAAGPAEIRHGLLACTSCPSSFPIENGIVHLLVDPTHEIETERQGIAKVYAAALKEDHDPVLLAQPWIEDPLHPGHWESIAANFQQALEWLQALDADRDKSELLLVDLGAGSCWSTAAFVRAGYACVALDISTHAKGGLGAAEIRMRAGTAFFDRMVGDMGRLPFRDASVDRVVTMDSIHHAASLRDTLRETHRILRPGGWLLSIAEPVKGLVRNRDHGHLEIEEYGWNEHSYTRAEYSRAMRDAGFRFQIAFPASIGARLESKTLGKKRANQVLGRVARVAWDIPVLRSMVVGPAFGPLQALFGLPLTVFAEKPAAQD